MPENHPVSPIRRPSSVTAIGSNRSYCPALALVSGPPLLLDAYECPIYGESQRDRSLRELVENVFVVRDVLIAFGPGFGFGLAMRRGFSEFLKHQPWRTSSSCQFFYRAQASRQMVVQCLAQDYTLAQPAHLGHEYMSRYSAITVDTCLITSLIWTLLFSLSPARYDSLITPISRYNSLQIVNRSYSPSNEGKIEIICAEH